MPLGETVRAPIVRNGLMTCHIDVMMKLELQIYTYMEIILYIESGSIEFQNHIN